MAAPVEGFVQLADDSGYTGKTKLVHAQHRVVGANTVYEEFVQITRAANVFGCYEGCLTQQSVVATAHDGITTAFLWMHMPLSVSGCSARIRRAFFSSQLAAATPACSTAPRLNMSRFTFTGTATGTQLTPDRDNMYRAPKLDLRTASTGLSVTLVAALATGGICGLMSTTTPTSYTPQRNSMIGYDFFTITEEDEFIVIAPGEGIVLYQDVNGTTSDIRKLDIQMIWDEIDAA